MSGSNYREVDIKIYNPQNVIKFFSLSNISFGQVKEMSQGDVSFTHPKHMLLLTVIKLDQIICGLCKPACLGHKLMAYNTNQNE